MQDFRLSPDHHELLRVTGPDAERLLQGQLTCDVAAVGPNDVIPGAACNNKGRVITPFLLLKEQQDFLLLFRQGLACRFVTALSKFLPFYKCRMEPEQQLHCLGLGGPGTPDWLARQGWPLPREGQKATAGDILILKVAGTLPQFLLLSPIAKLAGLEELPPAVMDGGPSWQALLLQNGHYPFDQEDCEVFTPQELRYDERQYVSFTKGCYTGQEIVARMHYRSKPKKRLYRVEFTTLDHLPPEPLTLLDDMGNPVAACSKLTLLPGDGGIGLAMLPIDFAQQHHTLHSSAGCQASLSDF